MLIEQPITPADPSNSQPASWAALNMSSSDRPAERLAELLMPYATQRTEAVSRNRTRFVQYTSAEAAVSILTTRRVWMRNATCMNDYTEMRFGLNKVIEAYASPAGMRLQQILNQIHPGLTDELQARFDPFAPSVLSHTYLSCFSEHRDDEDDHGRLSMWRAYGQATGVALVMNNHAFVTPSNALDAWSTPVIYIRDSELTHQFDRVARALEDNHVWLRAISRDDFLNALLSMLTFTAVSIKHIGFEEEREWRVVYLPGLYQSKRLEEDHVVIGGVPQPIFKIPLVNYPEEDFTGAEPSELINRLIIGPTQFPLAVRSTFLALLYKLGVPDPPSKVVCSGIPLRC